MGAKVAVACISWIDRAPLPQIWLSNLVGALFSWPQAVITGLVATANPRPETKIPSISAFVRSRQYRAVQACVIDLDAGGRITETVQDPGFTPPFDNNKINSFAGGWVPGPSDFSAGEKSVLSAIVPARLHPCSSITLKQGDKVIVNALIKFRAGPDTDKLGVEKAGSPVHVPWVWQEFALVSNTAGYRLVCNGSRFPSHAWYVDGQQVATMAQALVTVSKQDPILTVGRPASRPQSDFRLDRSEGPIAGHPETLPATGQIDVALAL
ncbi:hypothetical protein [Massilia sp. METH4]|uniref:hypothetical protein n=1 Tax=Massilia sp. METH4 TaxID=3123041 RepID=UPI0030D536CB